jgi:hypothetical protein
MTGLDGVFHWHHSKANGCDPPKHNFPIQELTPASVTMLSDTTNLFQRLSLDESLRRTVAVYRAGFLVFSQIGFLIIVTQTVLWASLLLVLRPAFGLDDDPNFEDPVYLLSHLGGFYGILYINVILNIVISAVFNGAMIRVVADIYLQRKASVQDCLQLGARHACTIMGASFLSSMAIVVGMLFLFAPGVYLSVKLFVVNPAIVIEGLGVIGSLKRSYNLVTGSWCYVFCTHFIAMTFMLVLQMVWKAIFAGGSDPLFTVWGAVVTAIPNVICVPIFACIMSIMYINLRVEKEGLNAENLAENLGESSGNVALYSSLLSEQQREEENPLV